MSQTSRLGARKKPSTAKNGFVRRFCRVLLVAVLLFYGFCALVLLALRWVDPPFVATHVERRLEALLESRSKGRRARPYVKRYTFVPLEHISPHLQHAVIAAEDGNFYRHHGFDWEQLRIALTEKRRRGPRGASTLTMQLVKNVFFGVRRSLFRKGLEFTLTPIAELLLPKRRILELYLNVVEWGPGVYGAEEAARYHYRTHAARLGREESARLAAILPSPRRRKPLRMDNYSQEILNRMALLGW